MSKSTPPHAEEESKRRRERLLNEFFRNAVALAILKQALVAGAGCLHVRSEEMGSREVPPYYLG